MADQFAEYVSKRYNDRFVISRGFDENPSGRIRIYGKGQSSGHSLVGITFHYPGMWSDFPVGNYSKHLQAITELGSQANVPVIWIGEYANNPTPADNQEIGPITEGQSGFESDLERLSLKDSIEVLWEYFDVETSPPSYGKSFNEKPVDGFHEFTIDKLGLTTIDMDMIALDDDGSPTGLVEIKRTFNYDIEDWYPFVGSGGDKPNYMLQIGAANQTSTIPYIISQPGRGYINDDDYVYLYDLSDNNDNIVRDFGQHRNPTVEDPELSYSRKRCTAQEAVDILLNI